MAWLYNTIPESMPQEVMRRTNATVRSCEEQLYVAFTVLLDGDVPAEQRGTKIPTHKMKLSLEIKPAEK